MILKLRDVNIILNESSSTYYKDWFNIDVSTTGYKAIAASWSINQAALVVYSFRLRSDSKIQIGIRTNSATGTFSGLNVIATVLYAKSSFVEAI